MTPLSQWLSGPLPDGKPVAWRGGETLCLGLLRARAAATAGWLRARRARRALIVQEDAFEFLALLLGTFHAGAEAVLPPNGQPGTLAALGAEADVLLTSVPEAEPLPLRPLDAEASRLVFFTSGSTAAPKRIGKALAQLEREVTVLEGLWGETFGQAHMLGMVSHQHIFGLTFRLLWPAMVGRVFAAHNAFAWETLLADLRPPTVLVVSPAHLARLEGLAPLPPGRPPLAVLTAGAPLGFAAARQCRELLGVLPTEIFGSTETGAIAWRRQEQEDAPWQALPGTELSLSPAGLLRIRSPNLEPGEVVESADRASLVPGGFRFAGRADQVVKVEGKRVSLAALETGLLALPEVAEVALLMHEERLGALLVPSPAGRALLQPGGRFRFERLLRRGLAGQHEPSALPRLWRFLPALPLDAMGKRDRAAMLALLAEQAPREPILTALRPAPGAMELDMALPPSLHWFQGHFPGFPLLPGVVQAHWAALYARRHLGVAATATGMQLKFRRPIRPWDRLTLALTLKPGRLGFTYRRADEVCATGTLRLA